MTVNSRVDGQIEKIAFTEGQEVKQGGAAGAGGPASLPGRPGVAVATRDKDRAQLRTRAGHGRYELLAPEDLASKQTSTRNGALAQLGAQIKGDEAAIDNAALSSDYTSIRSPINGRTGIRLVDPGNNVHAATRPPSSW